MSRRKGRAVAAIVTMGIIGWWARLVAHAKKPPPEGRWREYEPRSKS